MSTWEEVRRFWSERGGLVGATLLEWQLDDEPQVGTIEKGSGFGQDTLTVNWGRCAYQRRTVFLLANWVPILGKRSLVLTRVRADEPYYQDAPIFDVDRYDVEFAPVVS